MKYYEFSISIYFLIVNRTILNSDIFKIDTYKCSEIHVKYNPSIQVLPESQNKINVSDENEY